MADSILAGLESFGLEGLKGMSLYEDEKNKEETKNGAINEKKVPEFAEADFLLDKSMTCPLCEVAFKTRAIKSSRAKLLGTDMDLRPKYMGVDITKYDVISCPQCGYTALTRFFPNILSIQGKRIKETITPKFKPKNEYHVTISYEQALERYKLALVNAIVKGAKASEKAFICLKAAWICRGRVEELGEDNSETPKFKAMEDEYIKNAYDGFVKAVSEENFPMCGMDEMTTNYLIAVLAFKTDHLDVASKMIATILQSTSATGRMKDKTRDLKEEVMKKIKAKG